jgi:hypothetical protein
MRFIKKHKRHNPSTRSIQEKHLARRRKKLEKNMKARNIQVKGSCQEINWRKNLLIKKKEPWRKNSLVSPSSVHSLWITDHFFPSKTPHKSRQHHLPQFNHMFLNLKYLLPPWRPTQSRRIWKWSEQSLGNLLCVKSGN